MFGERLDVGRHTVREALRVLSHDGLIVRRAGTGSTVVSNGRRSVFAHSVTDFDQWFNYPASVRRRRIDQVQVVADAALAESLGCAVGTPWFRISALRTLDGAAAPLCWVDIYIQPRFARVMKSRQVDTKPIHEQINRCSRSRSLLSKCRSRPAGQCQRTWHASGCRCRQPGSSSPGAATSPRAASCSRLAARSIPRTATSTR